MFCRNCGKEIPNDTKFCNHCGAAQDSAPAQTASQPAPQYQAPQQQFQPQPPQNSPKNKKTIVAVIASVAVVAAAFVLGRFLIAPGMDSDPQKDKSSIDSSGSYSQQDATMGDAHKDNDSIDSSGSHSQQDATTGDADNTKEDTPNPAYLAIFEGTFIVRQPMFFNMETASFARKNTDGSIACVDFGYKDDLVLEIVETIYFPISGYTDAQKADLESKTKAGMAYLEELNCCTVTYNMSANYFSATAKYVDLGNADARAELAAAKVIPDTNPLSMSAFEQEVIAEGGVKK